MTKLTVTLGLDERFYVFAMGIYFKNLKSLLFFNIQIRSVQNTGTWWPGRGPR